jgi:hypothetical protein
MTERLKTIPVLRLSTLPARRWVIAEVDDANIEFGLLTLHLGEARIPMKVEGRGWLGERLALWLGATEAAPDAFDRVSAILEGASGTRAELLGVATGKPNRD